MEALREQNHQLQMNQLTDTIRDMSSEIRELRSKVSNQQPYYGQFKHLEKFGGKLGDLIEESVRREIEQELGVIPVTEYDIKRRPKTEVEKVDPLHIDSMSDADL